MMLPPASRIPAFLMLTLMLAGCLTTTPVSSLPQLMQLDFVTMDFQHVRAGLRLPGALSLHQGDALMTVRTRTDGVKGETVDTFALVEDTDASARTALARQAREGFTLSVWRMGSQDVSRLSAIQQRTARSRVSGPRVRGSIEIDVSSTCSRGPLPAGPLLVSSYLKPAANTPYITLTENADLRDAIGAADRERNVTRCEN